MALQRSLTLSDSYDLVGTLRPLADGGGDPTWRFERHGAERAFWSPWGAVTLRLRRVGMELEAEAEGPGSVEALEHLEAIAGLLDSTDGFEPATHPLVGRLHASRPGLLFGRSVTVSDIICPVVLGQRVTTAEARRSWRGLVHKYGHAAPGSDRVRLPPLPETVLSLGDHHWHALGVERGRAEVVRRLMGVLSSLEEAAGDASSPVDATRTTRFRQRVESVPGAGQWTSTALAIAVFGDPDVVLLGDLHVPNILCNALAEEPRGDDDRMLELLEPFRPHRGRVARLVKMAGPKPQRRGPKYTPLPISEM